MRIIKCLLGLILISAIAIAGWLYYPQYQIYKAKQTQVASVSVQKEDKKNVVTYLTALNKINKTQLVHLGLGDSVIKGYGATEGNSYLDVLTKELSKSLNKPVVSDNGGINGLTSARLKEELLKKTFDDRIKNADIISLNIGGNDILKSVRSVGYSEAFNQFSNIRNTYQDNIQFILNYIHEINPNATVIVFEQYNPIKTNENYYSVASKLLPQWNVLLYENIKDNELIAETTKIINEKHKEYISADGVHPSNAGYSAIAKQVMLQLKQTVKND